MSEWGFLLLFTVNLFDLIELLFEDGFDGFFGLGVYFLNNSLVEKFGLFQFFSD